MTPKKTVGAVRFESADHEQRQAVIATTETLGQTVSLAAACSALDGPRSTLYRARAPQPGAAPRPRPLPAGRWALSADEKTTVRTTLNSPRFQDCAPRAVYAALLEDDTYLCSVPTMYRILRGNDEVRERRDQQRHPAYTKPELLATAPHQVWTLRQAQGRLWDITKLLGPAKWTYYYLYVVLDLFSRKVVGWMIAGREAAELAEQLVTETCVREGIPPDQLTLHADHGSAMIAKSLALLLTDLGVRDSHSRPHVSNDNPRIEAHFGTIKSQPVYPGYFADVPAAVNYFTGFYAWYNVLRPLTTLGMLTPNQVHTDQAACLLATRQTHQAQALASRLNSSHAPFTLEELIAQPLPDVSQCPVYSWAGPNAVPQDTRHPWRN